MSSIVLLLTQTLVTFLNIYFALLIIRILLSWFPNVNWYDPPFSILSQLTDPYLNLFRSIIPPLGGLDFSPIIAILLLQVVQSLVPSVLMQLV
ncbi:Cell division protein YlmG/Ycf19 (putative) YggT family [Geitlerinema sp. FC II]|uniref:YggT family protein n=1 Tax=Baaleninema simplex TaxID=2862350 RepID=UPI000349E464|nr:YggT family protein [Baaleninema simplex]MDC0834326.1 YggT family protein [Geitlerinema sp. CS-897]PPT06234.1 Cell division protein YlmG/Ycf19 (putative) YggT family [Geitlerinema sp. FC II]